MKKIITIIKSDFDMIIPVGIIICGLCYFLAAAL
ncbi:hypothetical protein L584_12065 [Pantoea agglomerans Tx10]|nr:hypothetical protein L584_12065 [Pantoea agglomerans Tx10]